MNFLFVHAWQIHVLGFQLDSAEERVQELELITENPDDLGSVEVAASVTVLLTTTEDVGGNITVCAISLFDWACN